MKTLVLGGYGNFGARICRALAQDADIELIVGGRDLDRATAFAQSLGSTARGVCIDVQSADLARAIRDAGAELQIRLAGDGEIADGEMGQHGCGLCLGALRASRSGRGSAFDGALNTARPSHGRRMRRLHRPQVHRIPPACHPIPAIHSIRAPGSCCAR